jgi:tetratricopeptide (TPR) repeat protein/arylsulfatase A-like enzyme
VRTIRVTSLGLLGILVVGAGVWRVVGPSEEEIRPRVLLVGLDGLDWRILRPLLDRGEMANLASLIERGASGPLKSIEPLISPPIWTSIATGVKPERHGITWFVCDTATPGERIPVTSTLREAKAFWNVLSEDGRTVGIVGWWASYPAERVRGFVVSDFVGYHGFGMSGRAVETDLGKTYPPKLIDEVRGLLPDPRQPSYEEVRRFLAIDRIEFDAARRGEGPYAGPIQLFNSYLATARSYTAIAERLCLERRPEVLAVYFEFPDATSHLFARFAPPRMPSVSDDGYARFSAAVVEAYRHQDELLGRLLGLSGPDDVVLVVSDHGFRWGERRPNEGDVVEIGKAHGWHEGEGVFVFAGPGIRKRFAVSRASVLDVTPTLLRFLDAPLARDLDGAPLLDVFEPEWLEMHPPSLVEKYDAPGRPSPEDAPAFEKTARGFAEEQKRRLEGLGYVSRGGAPPEMRASRIALLLKAGRWPEAERELLALVHQKPADAIVRVLLGEVYRASGRLSLARQEFEAAAGLAPASVPLLCALAEVLVEERDLQGAEGWLRVAIERDPSFVRARLALGHALNLQGRPQDARGAFESVLALRPDSALAHYNLGVIEERSGRTIEAIERYREAGRLDPTDPFSRMNLGVLLAKRGDRKEALNLLAEAVRLAPQNPEARFNLGVSYLEEGIAERAVEELEHTLRIDPDFPWAHFSLGSAQFAANQPARALESFAVAAGLDARSPDPPFAIALVEASIGRQDAARASLGRAVALGGSSIVDRARSEPLLAPLLAPDQPLASQPIK